LADQTNRGDDVANETGDEPDSHKPERLFVVMQEFGVRVDFVGAREHLKISYEMSDDKSYEGESGSGDEPLLADGRVPELKEKIHGLSGLEIVTQRMVTPGSIFLRCMRFA